MKYIKSFENFKPITTNSHKPFKVKKNLDTNIRYLQKGIKSLRNRLEKQKSAKGRSEMNKDISNKVNKLSDVTFKQLKQAEYLKNNPVKESLENDEENLISILSSPDFEAEDIEKYIGLDENTYKIPREYGSSGSYEYDKNNLTLVVNSRNIEELANIEVGTIPYFLQITSPYSSYEYTMEDDELEYINSYLSDELIEKFNKLGKIFSYKIDASEQGEINKMLEYFCLYKELKDIKSKIEIANEKAITSAANKILKELPYKIDSKYTSKDLDLELNFHYPDIIEYMKEHKMNVKTIKEFIENVNYNDLNFEFEYEKKYDFLNEENAYESLRTEVEGMLDNFIDSPEYLFPRLIEGNNIKLFKKKLKLAEFIYNYDIRIDYKNERMDLFEIAKHYNNDILKWFKTYIFQKTILDRDANESIIIYKLLKEHDIVDPKIEKEYEYLIAGEKYNL